MRVGTLWALGLALLCAGCDRNPSPATNPSAAQPNRVPDAAERVPAGPDSIVEVEAAASTTCVRTRMGMVACFGAWVGANEENFWFSPGSASPLVIPVPRSAEVAVGDSFACSRDADGGQIRCWGLNINQRLGQPPEVRVRERPVVVERTAGATRLRILNGTACVQLGPQARCWGDTYGAGSDIDMEFVTQDLELAPGDPQTLICGTTPTGYACRSTIGPESAWHSCPDTYGRGDPCEDGTWRVELSASNPAIPNSTHIAWGHSHACGIGSEGAVWCAGDNAAGQLGVSSIPSDGIATVPIPPARSVAVGSDHSCAVTQSGELYCWGAAAKGQITLPRSEYVDHPQPIAFDRSVRRVFASFDDTCVEADDGVYCSGVFGDPDPLTALVRGPLEGVSDVSRLNSTPSIRSFFDQQGRIATVLRYDFVAVNNPGRRLSLSASVMAKDLDDVAFSGWSSSSGVARIRDGRIRPEHSQLSGNRFVSIAASSGLLCALSNRGRAKCINRRREEPAAELPVKDVVQIAVHENQLSAVTKTGEVREWEVFAPEPFSAVSLPKLPPMARVVHGEFGRCGVSQDHELWCWTAWTSSAERIATDVDDVAIGEQHGCLLGRDRRVACWGSNKSGQLANGARLGTYEPVNATEALANVLSEWSE